jgi:putative ABC transport system permease protein
MVAREARGLKWAQTCRLAWRDAIHEWPVSLCLVLALAAVLAPLLVLFGLKFGIVTTMTERLKADPRTVEISLRGHYQLYPAWFEQIEARPDVRFLLPRTRVLAATLTLETASGASLLDVDMLPTADGDPILPDNARPVQGMSDIIVTRTVAEKLDIRVDDQLAGILSRRLNDQAQGVRLPFTVTDILPEARFARDAVLVSLPLVVAAEDYRDGYLVPEFGVSDGTGDRPKVRPFASFRLYARTMDDVQTLATALRAQGLEIVTRGAEIDAVKAIDRVLNFVFLVLASIGVGGYLLSLASSLWANVDRKRREIALLRLIGFTTPQIVAFPAMQAALLASGGILVSAVIYAIVAHSFNATFVSELDHDEFVCRLTLTDSLIASIITLAVALLASIGGGYRAARIEPAEGLRAL